MDTNHSETIRTLGAAESACDRSSPRKDVAIIAAIGLGFLLAGLSGPFLSVSPLVGTPKTYGMLAGIGAMWQAGDRGIAAFLFLFSVAFPLAKMVGVLLVALDLVPLGKIAKSRLVTIADRTGKWSMLDVAVAGLVVLSFKADASAAVSLGWAVGAFAGAVAMSALASHRLSTGFARSSGHSDVELIEPKEGSTSMGRSRGRAMGVFLVLLGTAGVAAAWWLAASRPTPIVSLTIRSLPVSVDVGSLIDTRDIYLVAFDTEGRRWESEVRDNATMGAGLEFRVPPLPRGFVGFDPARIDRIEVWDRNLILAPSQLDHFPLRGDRGTGNRYEAVANRPATTTGTVSLLVGVVAALLAVWGGVVLYGTLPNERRQ